MLALFSASVFAHPIEQLYPLAGEISDNYEKIEVCYPAIESKVNIEKDCEYLAKTGGQVLEILVQSLEADGIEVKRQNRKHIKDIAWRELSFWEITYGAWVLSDDELEAASKYLGRNHPEMIRPHISPETYTKLEQGGFLE